MSEQASFTLQQRNPDVLTCIANLSNDEVFTPPDFANRMLDTLAEAWAADNDGADIWADSSVKFLDPCTKSGVFLREVAGRLVQGLAKEIPDLQARVDHILTQQIFGIGITKLTGLLARRSLYCSKFADGPHSIAHGFCNNAGNIWFKRIEHAWVNDRCRYCGANREILDRGDERENYAYAFIHNDDVQACIAEWFGGDMQFDVVIGNPPYQMTGGAGGSSDSSIYHLFVQQAAKLQSRYVSMVIPARWMAGGRGLDEFRVEMLSSGHLRNLTDFPDSGEAFPGVQIKGGICYFLWDPSHMGPCKVIRVAQNTEHVQNDRALGEFDVFVRDERALSILRKVIRKKEQPMVTLISGDTPFGIATNFEDWSTKYSAGRIPLYLIARGKRTVGFIRRDKVRKNVGMIDAWKVFVPEAYGAGETFPHQILGREVIAEPPSTCTQSYLVASPFQSHDETKSFVSYYHTRLFRFLVSLRKITQHALRSTYSWVPQQSWDILWTDELLYAKYEISPEEVFFIESMIRPMSDSDE